MGRPTIKEIEAMLETPGDRLAISINPDGSICTTECHGLDNPQQVFFYEQDYYCLSNFSSFQVEWKGILFPTSEHAYHWEKFDDPYDQHWLRHAIYTAKSAHDAFKLAEKYRNDRRKDWDEVKVGIMRGILCAKVEQHEYVRRKLIATGDRELIENSWRDPYWGWGPNKDGVNTLGKLWMDIRASLIPVRPLEDVMPDTVRPAQTDGATNA